MPVKLSCHLKKQGLLTQSFFWMRLINLPDHRGDPSAALLEVLDPEQNTTFSDHYLDLDYDLSQGSIYRDSKQPFRIPRPLMDRMEVINLPGYTDRRRLQSTQKYLVPKQKIVMVLTRRNAC